jgi:hypothetical protein
MVSRTMAVIVLLSAVTTAAEAQNRPTPAHNPRSAAPEPCIEPVRALTPMGLATAYIAVLDHASRAESLTVHALSDSTSRLADSSVAGLADMLYSLDAARHEYRYAGQVLDTFRISRDSTIRSFAAETYDIFDLFASWVVDLTAQLRRHVSGQSLTALAEADTVAAMHKRRDVLTELLGLNSTSLSYLLLDTAEAGHVIRLALSRTQQRDSAAKQLRRISRSQSTEAATTARLLLNWLTDPKWRTR